MSSEDCAQANLYPVHLNISLIKSRRQTMKAFIYPSMEFCRHLTAYTLRRSPKISGRVGEFLILSFGH